MKKIMRWQVIEERRQQEMKKLLSEANAQLAHAMVKQWTELMARKVTGSFKNLFHCRAMKAR